MNATQGKVHTHFFDARDDVFKHLADRVIEQLETALQTKNEASMVISGGGTPVPLFQQLARRPLAWDRVSITLADERWVRADHPDSNERLARIHLLVDRAASARFVPLMVDDSEPVEAETELNQRITGMSRPFDVVLLGMGSDGHTASLFPGGDRLSEALDQDSYCCAIRAPGASQPRMTLTPHALAPCGFLAILITGAEKRAVLATALEAGPVEAMPVRAILRQSHTPVHIFWAP